MFEHRVYPQKWSFDGELLTHLLVDLGYSILGQTHIYIYTFFWRITLCQRFCWATHHRQRRLKVLRLLYCGTNQLNQLGRWFFSWTLHFWVLCQIWVVSTQKLAPLPLVYDGVCICFPQLLLEKWWQHLCQFVCKPKTMVMLHWRSKMILRWS